MQRLSIVVAGVPALARALERTGAFKKVYAAESTAGLRDIIAGGLIKDAKKDELVFIFGDTLHVDTPNAPLPLLLQKLTTSGWKVAIVALSPRAHDLVKAYPAAGIIEGNVSVNMVLGAVAGMGFGGLTPVEDGYDVIDLSGDAALRSPAATSAAGGWNPAPVAPAMPEAPFGAPQAGPAKRALRQPSVPTQATAPASPVQTPAPVSDWNKPAAPVEAPVAAPQRALRKPAVPAEAPAPAPFQTPTQAPASDWNTPQEPDWSTPVAPAAPAAPAWGTPADTAAAPVAPGAPSGLGEWPAPQGAPVVPVDVPPARSLRKEPAPVGYGEAGGGLPAGFGEAQGPVARNVGGYGAQHAAPTRRGWVITVTAPKGGTGKSSLTLNLATYLGLRLRQQGKLVCVIDANFQQADTGKYLNVYNPNITGIVRDQSALTRERIGSYLVHKPELGISALLGPATQMDASPVYINARLYSQVLEVLRELYDYILIDTPVAEKYHDIFSGFALPQADYIIVPVAPNVATLMNADGWLRAVTAPRHTGGDGVDEAKIGVVLNRAKANIDCSEEEVRQELASWNFIGSIPETDEWQRCNNNNELVATKNYSELNDAFARVLFAATQEQVLLENVNAPVNESGGLGAKFKRFLGRG